MCFLAVCRFLPAIWIASLFLLACAFVLCLAVYSGGLALRYILTCFSFLCRSSSYLFSYSHVYFYGFSHVSAWCLVSCFRFAVGSTVWPGRRFTPFSESVVLDRYPGFPCAACVCVLFGAICGWTAVLILSWRVLWVFSSAVLCLLAVCDFGFRCRGGVIDMVLPIGSECVSCPCVPFWSPVVAR